MLEKCPDANLLTFILMSWALALRVIMILSLLVSSSSGTNCSGEESILVAVFLCPWALECFAVIVKT